MWARPWVQWLGTRLAMQGIWVQSLLRELRSHMLPQVPKPVHPGAGAPQEGKPLQCEACAPQGEKGPHSLQLEKAHMQQGRLSTATHK